MRSALAILFIFLFAWTGSGMADTVMTDQTGRKVSLPDRVERLVALVIPGAAMAMSVDLGASRLAGIHPAARQEIAKGILGRMMPSSHSIPANMTGEGFMPNIEALLAARPDVVLQWGDRGEAIIEPIAALDIPVVTFRYGSSELAADWLRLLGLSMTGRESRGEELASHFLSVRKAVAESAARVPEARRPKVLYLYRMQGNTFQVAGKNTSMDSDIRLAGGINAAGHLPGFAQIGVEQLLAWEPDVVLLNNFQKGIEPAMLFKNRVLAALPAVREKRVYRYPQGGFRWDPPSHESSLTWRWLFALFHPDRPSASLRAEIVDSYRMFYGFMPSSDDLDEILRIGENGGSRYYREKFGRKKVGL